jgi:quercetin dioxygenase-like cupin family protein
MKITKVNDISEIGITHNPEIKKKVFLEKNEIPQVMTFGQATFLPGQMVEEHKHDTMYEVFYIQSGKAEFIINNKKILVEKDQVITIEPKELHSQNNPFVEPVTWLYFGVAVD